MRIKYSMLPKLRNLTNREMDFFFCIATHQDLSGFVPGVHNRDVCRQTGMCKQSFYTAMRSLEDKGVITVQKASEIDYDIRILDNDFSYEGAFHEGYVSLQRKVFHQKKFQKLKANEKYLLLEFLKRTHENGHSYRVGTKKFYEIFTEMLGVAERTLRKYLHSLRPFFSIGIKDKKYYITYLHSVFQKDHDMVIEDQEFEHYVKIWCRRVKLSCMEDEVKKTARLLKQYRQRYGLMGGTLEQLKQILAGCIRRSRETGSGTLNERYVHKLLREAVFS